MRLVHMWLLPRDTHTLCTSPVATASHALPAAQMERNRTRTLLRSVTSMYASASGQPSPSLGVSKAATRSSSMVHGLQKQGTVHSQVHSQAGN